MDENDMHFGHFICFFFPNHKTMHKEQRNYLSFIAESILVNRSLGTEMEVLIWKAWKTSSMSTAIGNEQIVIMIHTAQVIA